MRPFERITSALANLMSASSDMEKIVTHDDYLVYEGWQEEIAEGMYQTFLFKMKETRTDRLVSSIDRAMDSLHIYAGVSEW